MILEKFHQVIIDGIVEITTVVDYAAKIGSGLFEPDVRSTTPKAGEL